MFAVSYCHIEADQQDATRAPVDGQVQRLKSAIPGIANNLTTGEQRVVASVDIHAIKAKLAGRSRLICQLPALKVGYAPMLAPPRSIARI